MSKDRLVIDDNDRYWYRLTWFLADEGEYGASLGDGPVEDPTSEHGIATLAAEKAPGVQKDWRGFYWESRSEAAAALKMAKAALKNRPLEDWEQKALAAGWKPPKGRL